MLDQFAGQNPKQSGHNFTRGGQKFTRWKPDFLLTCSRVTTLGRVQPPIRSQVTKSAGCFQKRNPQAAKQVTSLRESKVWFKVLLLSTPVFICSWLWRLWIYCGLIVQGSLQLTPRKVCPECVPSTRGVPLCA